MPAIPATTNRLGSAASPYLHMARHQPVAWWEWGTEAFAAARRGDRPILLLIGASWCHWCRVMDDESFGDDDLAALVNRDFVAIRVDRDEQPAVDARYQAAVAAISGHSGWPLLAILTPEGKPFFGGTYFPASERVGQPNLGRVLSSMAAAFRHQRAEVEETGTGALEAIEQSENLSSPADRLPPSLLEGLVRSVLRQFDPRHGGFGSEPKFPHPCALLLLLDVAKGGGLQAAEARHAVLTTLRKMAEGGVHDHLAGGFHRYSTDERWGVPRFEKTAAENALLLLAYAEAFQQSPDPRFSAVAAGILRWMETRLSDGEHGGFYSSQNADAAPGDDGSYFTWTLAETRASLSAAEVEIASMHFGLRPIGDMHANPAKNVLQMVLSVPEMARRLSRHEEDVLETLRGVYSKLRRVRDKRPEPFLDRTVYTGTNALCVSAFLASGRVLDRSDIVRCATRSLDRLLREAWNPARGLQHVVSYPDGRFRGNPVAAILDDYALLGLAALDAAEATREPRFEQAAEQLAGYLIGHFYDRVSEGFFDTEQPSSPEPLGAMHCRRKPIQDAPTPAGNSAAALFLLRLAHRTGDASYRVAGERTLRVFAGLSEPLGLYAAGYGRALYRFLEVPV